jgi:hypothetical protein
LFIQDQWKPNLVWIITRVSSFKIVSGDAVHQPTWPLLLKIEHMVKLQVLGNNSKTVNNIKNLTWSKNDQHIKSSFNLPHVSYSFWNKGRKVLKFWKFDEKREIETCGKLKLQTCSACQDLHTLQFWSKSHYLFWPIMQIRKRGDEIKKNSSPLKLQSHRAFLQFKVNLYLL